MIAKSPSDLPLGYFGKLPFWPEYLEQGVAFPTSRALKAFLLQGRAEQQIREEDTGVEEGRGRTLRAVVSQAGSAEILAAVLRPSRDLGGLRRFPFAVFVHLPRRLYARDASLLPAGLDHTFEALEDAWLGLAELSAKDAFLEAAGGMRIPLPRVASEARAVFEAALSRSAASVLDGHDEATVRSLGPRLLETVAKLKKEKDRASFLIELPVSRDLEDAGVDAAAWLEMLAHQFWRRIVEPSLFIDATPGIEARTVAFRFGELDPQDYPVLIGDRARHETPAESVDARAAESAWEVETLRELTRMKV